MYLWNINRLRNALAAGALDERARFFYMFWWIAVYSVPLLMPGQAWPEDSWAVAGNTVLVLTSLGGTYGMYYLNGGAAGRDFLDRYLSLGCVYSLRFFTVGMLAAIGLAVIAGVLSWAIPKGGPVAFVVSCGISVIYWAGFARHFQWVVAAAASRQVAPTT